MKYPNGNSDAMESIMDAMVEVGKIPSSRKQSLVKTKLDEAYLWLKDLENAGENIPNQI